ncbi:MAG: deoxycytidine triphosphate deaminase [Litorimonas sp.]
MFWSNDKLRSELPLLINRYNRNDVGKANYTLHVGNEVYITPNGNPDKLGKDRQLNLDTKQYFEIPPGQFAFLLTKEKVSIPTDVLAFISVRAQYKFQGLVNVSGFHVDPGFKGKLVFAVFNAGPSTVTLSEGEACFHIWFANLDGHSDTPVKPGYEAIEPKIVSNLGDTAVSLSSLNSKINKMETNVIRLLITAGILLALFGTFFVKSLLDNPEVKQINTPAQETSTFSEKRN